MTIIGRIGTSDNLGGSGDRRVLDVRKVKRFERLGSRKVLGG
jgi:hypothetical protein